MGNKKSQSKSVHSINQAQVPQPMEALRQNPTFERAIVQIQARHYEKAVDLLRSAGGAPEVRNAMGVCLLRLGRHEHAINTLRELVLAPGCTWMRSDRPAQYKVNFATALLLGGHPAGCVEVLGEIHNEALPAVKQLREAINRWQKTLTFWQRLNWKLGQVEPPNPVVSVDFEPGVFGIAALDEPPVPTNPPRDLRPAA